MVSKVNLLKAGRISGWTREGGADKVGHVPIPLEFGMGKVTHFSACLGRWQA